MARLAALRDRLYRELGAMEGVTPTVDVAEGDGRFLPNVVNVLVDGLESQTMILRLDSLGFGVSGGSACSSHSLEASHVLRAMGVDPDAAQGALRISMGRGTTEAHIEAFLEAVPRCLEWR